MREFLDYTLAEQSYKTGAFIAREKGESLAMVVAERGRLVASTAQAGLALTACLGAQSTRGLNFHVLYCSPT
jgi:hypothetical protein